MAKMPIHQLMRLNLEEDDLLIVIPRDPAHAVARTRVLVGDRPVGMIQSLSLTVSLDTPARFEVTFPTHLLEPGGSPNFAARLLANQALIAPWLDEPPQVPRPPGRSLWSRLDDDEST